jgi:hypothetical protein
MFSKKGSILLYAIFLSAFLLAFFAAFRNGLQEAVSSANSGLGGVVKTSALTDIFSLMRRNPASGLDSGPDLSVSSDVFDGRSYTGTAFSGSVLSLPIIGSGAATEFKIAVRSGAPAGFSVTDAS